MQPKDLQSTEIKFQLLHLYNEFYLFRPTQLDGFGQNRTGTGFLFAIGNTMAESTHISFSNLTMDAAETRRPIWKDSCVTPMRVSYYLGIASLQSVPTDICIQSIHPKSALNI